MKMLWGQGWPLGLWAGLILIFASACSLGTDDELRLEPIQVPMRSEKGLESPQSSHLEKGEKAIPSPATKPGQKPARPTNRKTTYLYQGQHEFDPELRRPDSPGEPLSNGGDWETIHARDKDLVLARFGMARFTAGKTFHLKIDPIRYWVPHKPSPQVEATESLAPGFVRHKTPLIFRSRSAGFARHPLGWDELLTASFQKKEPARPVEVLADTTDTLRLRRTLLLLQADEDPLDLLNGDATLNRHRYRQRAGK